MKKTKIVCTIGPKTESEEMLSKMLDAGMNVMRLNFSHGDYAEHGQRIQNLRNVMSKTGKSGHPAGYQRSRNPYHQAGRR